MIIIAWSIVSWAPTATMGMEVNKLSTADMATSYRRLSNANADAVQLSAIHLEHGPHEDAAEGSTGSTGELSGIYFGILNSKSSSHTNILTMTTLVPFFAVACDIWHKDNFANTDKQSTRQYRSSLGHSSAPSSSASSSRARARSSRPTPTPASTTLPPAQTPSRFACS